MNVKKITLLMLSAVMAFSFTGCSKKDTGEEQKKFDEFMKQEFVEAMEQSYPNTHIILENPKDYGVDISKTKIQIDKELNEATMKENKALNEKSAKAFKEFDLKTCVMIRRKHMMSTAICWITQRKLIIPNSII